MKATLDTPHRIKGLSPKEIGEVLKRENVDHHTKASRIKNLFIKHKAFLRTKYGTMQFKEPVMLFERRSGEVEFYEKVTVGLFDYRHSDGSQRFIILTPQRQKRFGFGDKQFKGYYCHEDFPLPLPMDAFLTTEQLNIAIEKALTEIKQWESKTIKARGDIIWKVLIGIAVIIAAYALFRLLVPAAPAPVIVPVETVPINPTPI
jgi:hypothetical protein